MHIDNEFPDRLLVTRKNIKLSQEKLADKVGITQRAIVAYEKGKSKPRDPILFKLAFALNVTPSWLAIGIDQDIPEWNDYTPTTDIIQIPIYELNDFHVKMLNKSNANLSNQKYFPLPHIPKQISKNAFSIVMQGDSMETLRHFGIPDGSIITFNPDVEVKSGDICLIKIDDIYTIKQLFIDVNQTTAHPLNPNYADIVLKKHEYEVIAKAVHISITV